MEQAIIIAFATYLFMGVQFAKASYRRHGHVTTSLSLLMTWPIAVIEATIYVIYKAIKRHP